MPGIFNQDDVERLVRTTRRNRAPKINFNEADSKILADFQNKLAEQGLGSKALRDRYKGFAFETDTYGFGLGLGKMPKGIYSGNLGDASDYTNTRINVLNDIINLFESAQSPEDLHRINALMQLSKEAAGNDENKAAHYKELIEAAKVAVSGDAEASKNFQEYDKSFIYDSNTARRTLNELMKRREHLMAVQAQGFDSYQKHGMAGAIDQHGLQTGLHAWAEWGTLKGLVKTPSVWKAIKTLRQAPAQAAQVQAQAQAVLNQAPILSRLLKGARFIGSGANRLLGFLPGYGKVLTLGFAAIWGTSKLIVSYNEKESFLDNIATSAKETFYGDADNAWAALGSWVLPGFGSMWGTDYFTKSKQKELKELKKIGAVA